MIVSCRNLTKTTAMMSMNSITTIEDQTSDMMLAWIVRRSTRSSWKYFAFFAMRRERRALLYLTKRRIAQVPPWFLSENRDRMMESSPVMQTRTKSTLLSASERYSPTPKANIRKTRSMRKRMHAMRSMVTKESRTSAQPSPRGEDKPRECAATAPPHWSSTSIMQEVKKTRKPTRTSMGPLQKLCRGVSETFFSPRIWVVDFFFLGCIPRRQDVLLAPLARLSPPELPALTVTGRGAMSDSLLFALLLPGVSFGVLLVLCS
mmetsp:Transcript_6980/g.20578  ORF Transcript_6980/g.20578 Transcript_6980/m.20578 type:complete len:262 (-) Transcript_6980:298-1083(-)